MIKMGYEKLKRIPCLDTTEILAEMRLVKKRDDRTPREIRRTEKLWRPRAKV